MSAYSIFAKSTSKSKSSINRALIVPTLICLLASASAAALEWDRLWLNDDQRGTREMEREQYASAAETFDDPRWKAAALYRSGEYQSAAEAWERLDDTEAHYNRGNALARSGDLQAAIAAYETVLKRNPDHADARHNLELLQKMMKDSDQSDSSEQEQQQEQQEQQNEGNDNKQESKQQQSQQDQSSGQQNEQQSGQSPQSPPQDQSEQMNQQQNREQQSAGTPDEKQQQSDSSNRKESEQQDQVSEPEDGIPDTEIPERQAAMEQWLRRIPDDPGGLLRRKFLYQYGTRHRRKEQVEQPW